MRSSWDLHIWGRTWFLVSWSLTSVELKRAIFWRREVCSCFINDRYNYQRESFRSASSSISCTTYRRHRYIRVRRRKLFSSSAAPSIRLCLQNTFHWSFCCVSSVVPLFTNAVVAVLEGSALRVALYRSYVLLYHVPLLVWALSIIAMDSRRSLGKRVCSREYRSMVIFLNRTCTGSAHHALPQFIIVLALLMFLYGKERMWDERSPLYTLDRLNHRRFSFSRFFPILYW